MMPQTVPNRPTKGAVEPIVASTPVPRDMRRPAGDLDARQPRGDAFLEAVAGDMVERLGREPHLFLGGLHEQRSPDRGGLPSAAPAAAASPRRRSRAARGARSCAAAASSSVLASQTVQVTREAKANPTITAFTTMSAAMNMPQGDRSCGSRSDASVVGSAASVVSGIVCVAIGRQVPPNQPARPARREPAERKPAAAPRQGPRRPAPAAPWHGLRLSGSTWRQPRSYEI